MKPVIIDTGFIVAALDQSEQHHQQVITTLDGVSAPLIPCEAVMELFLWPQQQGDRRK